jgi:hypothetical protein
MKRLLPFWWFKLILVLVGAFLLIQLVPYRVDNPSTRDEPKWDSPRTRELAQKACYDCHSNETKVLWFEHVAPVKWYVANHVKEGRQSLNFSEWSTNAGGEAHDAADPLREGSMPPAYYHYLGLHKDSKLTAKEKRELVAGLEKTIANDPPAGGEGGASKERDGG